MHVHNGGFGDEERERESKSPTFSWPIPHPTY